MSLHEIPNDSGDVDLSLGVGVHVGPPVLKVPDARDELVALPTARPDLARETIPLLCAVHLRGIVFVNGAAHVITVLLHNVRLLSRGLSQYVTYCNICDQLFMLLRWARIGGILMESPNK